MRHVNFNVIIDPPVSSFPAEQVVVSYDPDEVTAEQIVEELRDYPTKFQVLRDLDLVDEDSITIEVTVVEDGAIVSRAEWA